MFLKLIDRLYQKLPENNRFERIWILARTDFAQRFYGSSLGLLWAFLNPLFRLLVYYFVFSYLIFKQNEPIFILYLYLGLIPWMFFSEGSKRGMRLLNTKRYLLENIQLNKLDIFYSHLITLSIALAFNLITYFVFSLFFPVPYTIHLLWLPLLLACLLAVVMAVSLLLSTCYIFFLDLDHIWDIVLLLGFWTIPIIWDQRFIFEHYTFMQYVTPLTGLVINLRQVLLYGASPHWFLLIYDLLYAGVLLGGSLLIFKKFAVRAAEIR